MDRQIQRALIPRVKGHVAAGTTDMAESDLVVPVGHYFDDAYNARERTAVFGAHPLLVAHSSELPNPGDFVTREVVGTQALLVRQDDGGLRAFTNVCRHRGARVEFAESGNKRIFSCRYHGWAYDRDGALRSITYDEGFCGLDRVEHALVRLPADERHGLIWVVPSPGPELHMATYLGPELDAELASHRVGEYAMERCRTYAEPMNWKLAADSFLDNYHLKFLHPKTVGPLFHTNICAVDRFGRHTRMVQPRRSIERVMDVPPEEMDLLRYVMCNYFIFPNTVLVTEPEHFELWTFEPDACDPGRSSVTLRFLTPKAPETEAEQAHWDKNFRILMSAVDSEDMLMGRMIQAGIAGSGFEHIVLGRNEFTVQNLHRQLADVMGDGSLDWSARTFQPEEFLVDPQLEPSPVS